LNVFASIENRATSLFRLAPVPIGAGGSDDPVSADEAGIELLPPQPEPHELPEVIVSVYPTKVEPAQV
jgi:hypothetical protein